MVAAPILLIIIAVLAIVFVSRRLSTSSSKGQADSPLRSFFQYILLFALMFVVANGVSGLLGRVINPSTLILDDNASLARNLSFVVVGIPLFLGIGAWTRKSLQTNPQLTKEPQIAFFLTLAIVIALLNALSSSIAVFQSIGWSQSLDGQSTANAIVWIAIWYGLWRIQNQLLPAQNTRVHYFVGSFIGYLASIIGLVSVFASAITQIVGMNNDSLIASGARSISDGLIVTACSALVWVQYWIRTASKASKDSFWNSYVLIAGVGGGLVMSVAAASTSLYTTAVWFFGDPRNSKALIHFAGTPTSAGVVIVGLLAWWYHKSLLPESVARSEINRVYDYLISGIGLIASAVGLSIILIAIIEASISSGVLISGSIPNRFLAAATLVIVGGPVWLTYWRNIQQSVKTKPDAELSSPARRVYLFILFGIGGIAAIISLLVGVYQLFNDVFSNSLGTQTIRDMRVALGVLSSTAIVSAYHWEIYRHERDHEVAFGTRGISVLLVGPKNKELERLVQERLGAKVTTWKRIDSADLTWPSEHVVEAIQKATGRQLVVVLEQTGVKVIPVEY